MLLSMVIVYSSSTSLAFKSKGGNTEAFLIKHFIFACVGFGVMFLVHKINYKYFSRLSQIGFIVTIPLLLLTLLIGKSEGGASRWLEIPGIGLAFQTSDLAKIVLFIYLARTLATKQKEMKDFKVVIKSMLVPVCIICGLILPANFSTAALIFLTALLIMYVGGMHIKHIFYVISTGIVFLLIIVFIAYAFPGAIKRAETWKARIENFSSGDKAANYQSEQAKMAVANGYLFGVGPGKSIARNNLPQAASDFIYATFIEEWGILGIFILFLYMVLFFRSIKIFRDSDKTFGGLLAVGLSFSLVFQALINMAVAVTLMPVTGQPLPLISMGGTSVIFTCVALGIILSVSRKNDENEKIVEEGGEYAIA